MWVFVECVYFVFTPTAHEAQHGMQCNVLA